MQVTECQSYQIVCCCTYLSSSDDNAAGKGQDDQYDKRWLR